MKRKIAGIFQLLFTGVALHGLSACGEDTEATPQGCSTEPGVICTWAGNGKAGFDGDDHVLSESRFYWPVDVTFASTGEAYVLDWNNHRVRSVTPDGTLRTVIGTDFVGDGPEDLSDLTAPGALGTDVNLNHPTQLLESSPGHFLLVSWHNHKLRAYTKKSGRVQVLCGRGPGFNGDGPFADVRFNQPSAARFDEDGRLYVLDQRNQRVRRISELGADGLIETVVGTGEPGFSGDGGSPLAAQVSFPTGTNPQPAGSLTLDRDGRLYFADTLNQRVRRVDFEKDSIETVLGDGRTKELSNPRDVELGPDGRIYVADQENSRVLALEPDSLDVEVVAGTGKAGYAGDGGAATDAQLRRPAGLAFDAEGNLYIADTYNHRIRVVYDVAKASERRRFKASAAGAVSRGAGR